MRKNTKLKVKLAKETLRRIDAPALARVAGGTLVSDAACIDTVNACFSGPCPGPSISQNVRCGMWP